MKLNEKQREVFGNKVLDIGALAVGALIFGQFLSGEEFQWGLTIMGILIFFFSFLVSYFLLNE